MRTVALKVATARADAAAARIFAASSASFGSAPLGCSTSIESDAFDCASLPGNSLSERALSAACWGKGEISGLGKEWLGRQTWAAAAATWGETTSRRKTSMDMTGFATSPNGVLPSIASVPGRRGMSIIKVSHMGGVYLVLWHIIETGGMGLQLEGVKSALHTPLVISQQQWPQSPNFHRHIAPGRWATWGFLHQTILASRLALLFLNRLQRIQNCWYC